MSGFKDVVFYGFVVRYKCLVVYYDFFCDVVFLFFQVIEGGDDDDVFMECCVVGFYVVFECQDMYVFVVRDEEVGVFVFFYLVRNYYWFCFDGDVVFLFCCCFDLVYGLFQLWCIVEVGVDCVCYVC